MSKMKKLEEYMTIRCPLWEDVTRAECKEAGVNYEDFDCKFLHHEVDAVNGTVSYFYQCDACDTVHEVRHAVETDFVYIGECPSEENPFKKYTTHQTCQALRVQLRTQFGTEPEGAELLVKYEGGADGYTMVCRFDTRFPLSLAYAYMLEGNLPEKWSKEAIEVLEKITGRPHVEVWKRFWFESNVVWCYVDNVEMWEKVKRTLKDNNYETSPLAARRDPKSTYRFGLYAEYTDDYTLADFFRDNNMTP